ncbi:MAG: beta-lactamase family protein [Actinomycetales bacterium]|nr:beta-lactamase family protein [Actinomycetales bacterium]
MLKLIRNIAIGFLALYLALFGLTKAIHYPEPIAAIKLGLAPASKTPDLMPANVIAAAPTTFAPWQNASQENITTVNYNGSNIAFSDFLETTHTNAFLVVRHGKIAYENYLNGKTQSSRLPSYSVAKTMTSLIIGQLIAQGKIKESDTFVSFYPEYRTGTSFDKVTVKNLLDMNSGIGVSDNYPTGPSGWGVAIAQMYATTDMKWFVQHNRKMREQPGTFPEYRSVNTQLLGMIAQKVTSEPLSNYFTSHIWQAVGADFDGTWNVDHVGGFEKAFCCFNAAARDYARIGVAVMNQDPKIISSEWVKRISTPAVKLDYGWGYSAQVWHPYPGINLMLGLHGQFIYMDKANDTVIVKLSDEPTKSDNRSPMVAAVLKQISEQN